MGMEPHRYTKVEAAYEFTKRMKHVEEEAQSALTKAKEEMKRYAVFHQGEPPKYKVGDKVWLEMQHLKIARPSKKLLEKRIGPYPITEIKSSNAVKLGLPKTIRIRSVVNVSHVCPYKPSIIPKQSAPQPPPVEVKGEFEYEVEQILDS